MPATLWYHRLTAEAALKWLYMLHSGSGICPFAPAQDFPSGQAKLHEGGGFSCCG